jgi:hypothetical protein
MRRAVGPAADRERDADGRPERRRLRRVYSAAGTPPVVMASLSAGSSPSIW